MNACTRIALAVALACLFGCSATGNKSDAGSGGDVVAEVDGRKITLADVDKRIEAIPSLQQPEYAGALGRARMTRRLVEEELLYRAALDAGLDRDPEVERQVSAFQRELLSQTFLERERDRVALVTEDEARAFYAALLDDYQTERLLQVRVVVTHDSTRAGDAKRLADEGKLHFDEIAARLSDHELVVANRGLIPGWVHKGRAIPWIGNHPAFHKAAFALERRGVSDVISTPAGYLVVRIDDEREARQRPFEEARADVEARIVRSRTQQGLPELLQTLEERYHARVYEIEGRSAEELFQLAQAEADPATRVSLYEELLARFPENERALESLFMIGFIRSEDVRDAPGADAAFERVIEFAPDSELARSARWMVTSHGEEAPEFSEDSAPDSEEQP
jgi:EpsD family peptidyl-prolyl cis-trans isomerase